MDLYLTSAVLYEIYSYLDWYTLRYYDKVPSYFWKQICDYFCQDEIFRSTFKRLLSINNNKLTDRLAFLNLIYVFIINCSDITEVPLILLKSKYFILSYIRHLKNKRNIIATIRYIIAVIPTLQLDKDVVLTAVETEPSTLKYLDPLWKLNREVVLKAIEQDGTIIEFADPILKADKELGLIACKQNGYQFLDNSLKSDPDIIYEALKANVDVVSHFDDEIKNNSDIMLEAGRQAAKQSKIIWVHLGLSLMENPMFVSKFLQCYDCILNG